MKDIIESAFEDRNHLTPATASPEIKDAVNEAIHLLDSGKARVAEQKGVGDWQVNEWLKKAVLLSFRLADNTPMPLDIHNTLIRCPLSMQLRLRKSFKHQVSG
jgi:2,3,4,5-tetrahydropyridine-2-carboxylate N-succinyltransferase